MVVKLVIQTSNLLRLSPIQVFSVCTEDSLLDHSEECFQKSLFLGVKNDKKREKVQFSDKSVQCRLGVKPRRFSVSQV